MSLDRHGTRKKVWIMYVMQIIIRHWVVGVFFY